MAVHWDGAVRGSQCSQCCEHSQGSHVPNASCEQCSHFSTAIQHPGGPTAPRGSDIPVRNCTMAPSTVGVTYTIALDSTFLVAVCLYHLLLVLLHVYLAKSAKGEQDQNSQPAKCSPQSESESDEADLVTCRAPTLYVCQSKAAECYHSSRHCGKLACSRSVKGMRPCSECVSIVTMHRTK